MAFFPDFDSLKTEILLRISQSEVCDAYYEAVNATDFQTLVAAGCGYYRWLGAVIMDNDMLDAIPEENLNPYGIYRADVTLTDPLSSDYLGCKDGFAILTEDASDEDCGQVLWFIRGCNFTVNITGTNIVTIYAMGDSVGIINLSDTSRANVFAVQNSTVTINSEGFSSVCLTSNDTADVVVNASGNSVVNAWVRGNSTLSYYGNDSSSATIKSFGKSITTYSADVGTFFQLRLMSIDAQWINIGATSGGGSGSGSTGGTGGGTSGGGTGGGTSGGGTTTVFKTMTWTVDGLSRSAYVWQPVGTNLPILFAYHGHGGTGTGFSRKHFESYEFAPNSIIVVYPNGLRTPSGLDSTARNTGWQHTVGEVDLLTGKVDKDLNFYDAMLSTFAPYIDSSLIFNHGWSNGGEFVYDCLWVDKQSTLNSICGAAAIVNTTSGKNALPVLHVAGETDPYVPFSSQQSKFDDIKTLNGCSGSGTTWASGANGVLATEYACSNQSIFLEYDGGHAYPSNVPQLISRFFSEQLALP